MEIKDQIMTLSMRNLYKGGITQANTRKEPLNLYTTQSKVEGKRAKVKSVELARASVIIFLALLVRRTK